MNSALYIGSVRHRRLSPRLHDFRYHMAYFYLDLAETERLFRFPLLFAKRGPSILAFRRRDYFTQSEAGGTVSPPSLDESVRALVNEKLGKRPRGPIRVLTQLSYFGFCFNPVSFYYCFDEAGSRIEFIVADVTNTPWKERHTYVVGCKEGESLEFGMQKAFHVSPFMPMEIDYRWRLTYPAESLGVHMESLDPSTGELIFDATMSLRRHKLTLFSLVTTLVGFPLLTIKAILAIYFEAAKLKLKGIRYVPKPLKTGDRP